MRRGQLADIQWVNPQILWPFIGFRSIVSQSVMSTSDNDRTAGGGVERHDVTRLESCDSSDIFRGRKSMTPDQMLVRGTLIEDTKINENHIPLFPNPASYDNPFQLGNFVFILVHL